MSNGRQKPVRSGRVRLFLGLCVGMTLSGCAVDYVDDQGVRHIIGLAAVEIPPLAPFGQACVQSGLVSTAGVLLYSHEGGSGVGLGYVREGTALAYECPVIVGTPPP